MEGAGLWIFLILMAIALIIFLVYTGGASAVTKIISTPQGMVLICILIALVFAAFIGTTLGFAWWFNWSPLFNKEKNCRPDGNDCKAEEECVDTQNKTVITSDPPLCDAYTTDKLKELAKAAVRRELNYHPIIPEQVPKSLLIFGENNSGSDIVKKADYNEQALKIDAMQHNELCKFLKFPSMEGYDFVASGSNWKTTGIFGTCDSKSYQAKKAVKSTLFKILMGFGLLIVIAVTVFFMYQRSKAKQGVSS